MLMASNDPALYDLYNSPSRSPFSNVAGLGIGGMNFAGSPESPFASSIRGAPFNRFPPRTGGPRPMRPPGLMQELPPITGGARPMGPPGRDFQAELQTLSRPSQKPENNLPISTLPAVISDDTGFFEPQPPAPFPPTMSQPPRPFGGNQFGGIGGFFNQLAMMSPEQYDMGMNRFNQFNQRFGPSMGGGYGMFNQLAQLSPEQYDMGMDRFNQFNQRFGGFPPQNVAPPPMTGGPRPMGPPMMSQPISRPFGGGFGGQGFQPPMMPQPQFNQFGGGFGGFNQAPNPFGGSFNSPLRQFMGPQILPFNMQPMMGQPQTSTPMPPPNMTPTQGQPQTSTPMPPPSPQQGQLQTSTPMPAAMF